MSTNKSGLWPSTGHPSLMPRSRTPSQALISLPVPAPRCLSAAAIAESFVICTTPSATILFPSSWTDGTPPVSLRSVLGISALICMYCTPLTRVGQTVVGFDGDRYTSIPLHSSLHTEVCVNVAATAPWSFGKNVNCSLTREGKLQRLYAPVSGLS